MQREFTTDSATGTQLYVKEWKKDIKEYKGVIQLVHGMQEHIERYAEFASFLAQNDYIVIAHDQLGHGKTVIHETEMGYFAKKNGWNILVEDIHLLQNKIKGEYPNLPYIMMGHSMGSLLVRTYLTKYQDKLDGAILSGTSGQKWGLTLGKIIANLIITIKGEHYRSSLLEYLITGSFNKEFKPNKTKADWTTRNEEEVKKYIKDPRCGVSFTTRAYLDLMIGASYLSKQKNINKTIHIPILLFSGDKDPVGRNGKGVTRVCNMLKKAGNTDIQMKLFKDGRHEMLNELNKQEVYSFILEWLQQHIQASKVNIKKLPKRLV